MICIEQESKIWRKVRRTHGKCRNREDTPERLSDLRTGFETAYINGSTAANLEYKPEVFDMVQVEMKNRALLRTRYSGRKVFGSKIKCGDCGSFYGSKVWHFNDK
ncbi:hypothetical protein [[Clostridium] aminophilum]|uniref:hypothetical protein n=1 Tax=[Clostridium] aminophilum TaxID=1526 RepID=UPI0026EFC4E4|nr:hypothetical protein [[Clostridium] aminophilum]